MAVTKQDVASLIDAQKMIQCAWPRSGSLIIAVRSSLVHSAMALWQAMPDADRANRFSSVRRAMKKATKNIKRGRATAPEMDGLAADIALFLAHELAYSDGERWLVKGVASDEVLKN